MKRFLFSYTMDGAQWSFDVVAKDRADAERRLFFMRSAQYDGELVATVPVPSWWARLFHGWRQK